MVRSNSEPRSNSPVTGSLLRSFSRARRARARIIHTNESTAAATVNFKSAELVVFRKSCDSNRKHDVLNFAPESS
jgi:hypothetical protein